MDTALKAVFEKLRASFTRHNVADEVDVLESPLDPPLTVFENNTVNVIIPMETVQVGGGAEIIARCNENARLAREKSVNENFDLQEHSLVLLPNWPDPVRGMPNGVLRSALFGAIKKGGRKLLERQEIASQDSNRIFYTGARLDQGDGDVWQGTLHISRQQAMGSQCRFTAYSMLKLLGKTNAGSNHDTLHKRLMRLKATSVEVEQGQFSYAGSLIDDVYRDKKTQEYVVILNPKLRALFEGDQYTQIDWNVRHALSGQPLAQWLHGYYSSHAQPFPVKVDTLYKLCGSETALVKHFKQDLQKALDSLTNACNANEQPFSYEIRGDVVHIERKASPAQRRHLAKKHIRTLLKGSPQVPSQHRPA